MKTCAIFCLHVTLLSVAFVQAQDFIKLENSAQGRRSRRPSPERHLHKVETAAWAQKLFRSREDSLHWRDPAPPFHKWGERWEAPLRKRGFMDRSTVINSKFPLQSRQAQNVSSVNTPDGHSLTGHVQDAWRRHYASGLLPAYDVATAMVSDSLGDIYVTGYSTNRFGFDYFTAKYNAAGLQVWSARYNGAADSDDRAFAIAVDISGNVYVTGESYDTSSSADYATIKYNSTGVEQWVARYHGPENFDEHAIALAVNAAGNVYVTGRSWRSNTHYDYATVKYNAAGVEEWVALYNGPGNSDDVVHALSVDDSGNVYVTGYSYGSGTSSDYATIKYNSAGATEWIVRYNGLGNNEDVAYALAIDNSGNVYVTGAGYDARTGYDYATVKYNSAGALQWVARYNGPDNLNDYAKALSIDATGNVHVMGVSAAGALVDYATVKYDSAGVQQWVARYNGPENSDDIATAMTLDRAGNVYVTGYSGTYPNYDYATVKYNSAGAPQWVVHYNGPANADDNPTALAVDPAGNVYVTGYVYDSDTNYDYAMVKYNSAGAEQWGVRYNGPGNSDDAASALGVDAAGNVYVTGRSFSANTGYDYATIKYNSAGIEQWIARYNEPGNADDHATALAVDLAGNIYVTGCSYGIGTSYDYATIKYNSAGAPLWIARYNGPGNSDDHAIAIAVDLAGNVYVTGYSRGIGAHDDYATVKYNTAGMREWVVRYNGSKNSDDKANALAVDLAGNIYVTGSSVGAENYNDDSYDYATIKYNSAGTEQWMARYNGPGSFNDYAIALAVDPAGNVYVTGYSYGAGTSYDYATIKYNSAGASQWVARYNGPGNSDDNAAALAVDPAGNVYVTGWSSDLGFDYATVKYNGAGVEQWVARYNEQVNGFNYATALALDPAGNVYVTGYSVGAGTGYDYATIKYTGTGAPQWIARSDGPGHYYDYAHALVIDNLGNVYVTGRSYDVNTSRAIYTTIKYIQGSLISSVKTSPDEMPAAFELGSNYPNPFWNEATSRFTGNPETTIQYILPAHTQGGVHVTLRIYNLQGQLVRTLVDAQQSPGRYRVVWDGKNDASARVASGVYLYAITAGHFKAAKSMAILK